MAQYSSGQSLPLVENQPQPNKPETVKPPSTTRHWPVMYEAAGIARNATAAATSDGSPTLPRGVRERILSRRSGSLSTGSVSGVRMYHGATALTRMPSLAHSDARARDI